MSAAPTDAAAPAGRGLPRPRNLARLSAEFTAARWRTRSGDGVLAVLSIIAFAVAATIANIVASGTWMFRNRAAYPTGVVAEAIAEDASFDIIVSFYVVLALLACVLLVFPVVHLATSATLLGARSRERRLAILRLVGMTRSEVSLLGFLEVMLQALLGVLAGGALTIALLPAFQKLTFQAMQVRYEEMLLPWWGYLVVAAVLLAITAAATAAGLARVRISPLGVARREPPAALRWWPVLAAVAVLVAVQIGTRLGGTGASVTRRTALGLIVALAFILVVDVVMPRGLQLAARLLARLSGVTVSWASRRVAANPKPTWRRVGVLTFMVLITSFFGQMPVTAGEVDTAAAKTVAEAFLIDIRLGMMFTIGFSFALAAVSAMVNQASAEFERAEETRAMLRMGVSDARLRAVNWLEALGPLVGAVLLALGLGWLMASLTGIADAVTPDEGEVLQPLMGHAQIAGIAGAGIVLMVLALAATAPIHRRVITEDRER